MEIKVSADYMAFPLWTANGGMIDIQDAKEFISGTLIADLIKWNSNYELNCFDYDQTHPMYGRFDIGTHDIKGMELAKRVKSENPNARVKYFSEAKTEWILIE